MDSEFIINGIMNGFSLIDGNHSITDIPISETQNHRSATDPNIVHKVERQIFIEIQDGNYVPVGSKPRIISALGAIPKCNGDVRLIHDASLATNGSALNDYASKDPCSYQTVSDALANLKSGYYMAKVDLQSAYRSVSTRQSEHTLTGLKWKFLGCNSATFLVDTKLPFGARKSPSIFNRISQSVQRMMTRRGFNCVVIRLLRSLGFRINWHKVVDPCQDLVFLGIRINTVSGVLSLDPSKAEEVVALLDHSLEARRLSKHQLQRLAGKLSWASNVVTWGRAHLWHIFHSIRRLKHKSHKIPSKCIYEDIVWWRDVLALQRNRCHIWDTDRPTAWLYTDASHCGGGAFCHGNWLYTNWRLDTHLADTHINIKEFAMIREAVVQWGPNLSGHKVLLYTDNMAAKAISTDSELLAPSIVIF